MKFRKCDKCKVTHKEGISNFVCYEKVGSGGEQFDLCEECGYKLRGWLDELEIMSREDV